jgi:hypothetical protein
MTASGMAGFTDVPLDTFAASHSSSMRAYSADCRRGWRARQRRVDVRSFGAVAERLSGVHLPRSASMGLPGGSCPMNRRGGRLDLATGKQVFPVGICLSLLRRVSASTYPIRSADWFRYRRRRYS